MSSKKTKSAMSGFHIIFQKHNRDSIHKLYLWTGDKRPNQKNKIVGNEYLKELIYGSSFTTSKLISNMEETPS
jgi:hypothetical protein